MIERTSSCPVALYVALTDALDHVLDMTLAGGKQNRVSKSISSILTHSNRSPMNGDFDMRGKDASCSTLASLSMGKPTLIGPTLTIA